MKKWIYNHLCLISFGAIAAILALSFLGSFAFQPERLLCEYNKEAGYTDCAQYHLGPFVLVWLVETIDHFGGFATALGTAFIALFTWTLWRATDGASKHFRVTERAYVKISHVTPKTSNVALGVANALNWSISELGAFDVVYQIKNHGRTPARVTDVRFTCRVLDKGQTISSPISYDAILKLGQTAGEPDRTAAFLVVDDHITYYDDGRVSVGDVGAVVAGTRTLIIYGYVDYIDQFGVRHRGGYGRQYSPEDAGNNLIFPDEFPSLNYDRVRERGQGADWNLD